MKVNTIYHGDCLEILTSKIKKNSIPLVYADPPYNLSGKSLNLKNNKTGGAFYKMNEDWDTWKYGEYLGFTRAWINKVKNVMNSKGSLYISCTKHNIGEIIVIGKELNLKLNNILTWYKTNAMPNITKRTFTHSTEFVCWFVKGKKWIFNYQKVKEINPHRTKNGEAKQMRDFLDFIEIPLVQGKERLKNKNGRALHPTQKPVKLIELIILASSKEGDIILDPFFGTGTTGYVAEKLNRNWVGIEKNKKFVEAAKKRLRIKD
jgi:site-specific DNA-methyltransferase (adenine-specific)